MRLPDTGGIGAEIDTLLEVLARPTIPPFEVRERVVGLADLGGIGFVLETVPVVVFDNNDGGKQ